MNHSITRRKFHLVRCAFGVCTNSKVKGNGRCHSRTFGASAVPAHLAHGDTLGPCGTE
jgi:hypothetical protein